MKTRRLSKKQKEREKYQRQQKLINKLKKQGGEISILGNIATFESKLSLK